MKTKRRININNLTKEDIMSLRRNPDLRDKHGFTFLMKATKNNDLDFLKLLIELGADLDLVVGGGGYTALMLACIAGHSKCVKILAKSGANRNLLNSNGETASNIANSLSKYDCLDILDDAARGIKHEKGQGNNNFNTFKR